MNEESDGMNENENNNSEVVILPERSHVEELLLSDHPQIREEQNAYERKLDEKLKDLGLYEDDMTINQKEELLAVVVISCETAEQEENKRQLIREYLEGAQSLEEEIEFSFQESAWLAGEANLLCSSTVTRAKEDDTSPDTKVSSSFGDGESSTSGKKAEVFDSILKTEKSVSRNSPDIFDDEAVYAEISMDPQSSSSENQIKRPSLQKGRSRGGKKSGHMSDANMKIGITHPILHEQDSEKIETTEILDRQLSFQRQKLLLDKSMGSWKPCMSPKDKPLSNFRLTQKGEEKKAPSPSYLQEKFSKYLTFFEKTASSLKSKRSSLPKVTLLGKPYVLMHHGSVAKKAPKLDNYDYIVGVSEKSPNNEDNEDKFMPCNTLTRAKSAFHRVKPFAHGKLVSFTDKNAQSDTPSKTTRSGATYGSKRLKPDIEKSESSPEVIVDEQAYETSEKRVTFNEDVIADNNNKLPKFSDMRPDANKCKMVIPSPVSQKDSAQANSSLKYNCDSHAGSSGRKFKREEKIRNRTENDYSSDSSSPLIDVETVVDDEIEEFVMKRKLPHISQKSTHAKIANQPKRLKKSDS